MFSVMPKVFQPSYLTATGPSVTALLLGNTSKISLNLRTVSPSNETGKSHKEHLILYSCNTIACSTRLVQCHVYLLFMFLAASLLTNNILLGVLQEASTLSHVFLRKRSGLSQNNRWER